MATETLNHEMAASEDAKRPIVERLVIFFRSLFTRTYFYSGEVHIAPMQVKHIDGVLQITSFRRHPKLAWNTARSDVMKTIDCDAASVHLQTLSEI